MVCHYLQLSAIVPYTCSTLCALASGLITLRGGHSWANNEFLKH